MDGVHDLGGMHGFGPVEIEADEQVFHAEWERRVLAVTLAMGAFGRWSIDRSRHVRESLPPATYLGSSYYEIWLRGLRRLLAESDLLETTAADEQTRASGTESAAERARDWPTMRAGLERGSPYERAADRPARFTVDELVRTVVMHPPGHTRLPRYARGKLGRIVAVRGAHVFPDGNAGPERPTQDPVEWLYTVAFEAGELFGADANPTVTVTIDAFEPYLDAVAAEAS